MNTLKIRPELLTEKKLYAILMKMMVIFIIINFTRMENTTMERIKTLETRDLCESAKNGGCGECQTSCQSACKTSCGVANQQCENTEK